MTPTPAIDGGSRLPWVTVLVATYNGTERIGACLDSLVRQSLPAPMFEIVVVQNGPACGTPDLVRALQAEHPDHTIRLIETPEPGAANARNLGIDAACGQYVTIVDDDDWVSPGFLEALLAAARPGVVPTALLCDVPETAEPGSTDGTMDNYFSSRLGELTGQTIDPSLVPVSMSLHAAKLLPTDLARQVRYDQSLRSGEDFVFLASLHAAASFDVHVLAPDSGALYYRSARAGSVSRREADYGFAVSERLDCVAALYRVPRSTPSTAHLIDALVRAQTSFTAQYLAAHPERWDDVRADARTRGITYGPFWSTLNAGQAHDLALLYLFPPFQDTSALVASRRLLARGLITDVISQDATNIRERDGNALRIAAQVSGRRRILPGPASFTSWAATSSWAWSAVEAAAELAEENDHPYRSVYTRAMAPQSHFAGALMKVRHPEIHWIAEFSDPLHYNAYGETRKGDIGSDELRAVLTEAIVRAGYEKPSTDRLFEWAEIIAYALADEIVFTNENQRTFMLDYTADRGLADRALRVSRVEHHPTLPDEFYEMEPFRGHFEPGTVNIGYFGAFYLTRGLTEVRTALSRLSPAERARVRLHVYTADPGKLRLEALRADLADVLIAHPYLPFLEFLSATRHFDALLVNDAATRQHHDINPYLPSKISDYRGSGTPIWSIVEPGSVLSTLATEYRSTLGDADGATRVISAIIAAGRQH